MKTEKEIIPLAHERFMECKKHWSEHHQRCTEILKFISGAQWTDQARAVYESRGFAAITSPRLQTFLRQICNEMRQNKPSLQIDPKDNSKQDTAEVIADLIRSIEQDSHADIAYDQAGWFAAATGVGYFRINSEYEDDTSFDQRLCIEPIMDVNTVFMDPNHRAVDGSDCEYVFIVKGVTKDEYKRKYATSKLAEQMETKSWTGANLNWYQHDLVVIAEYYFCDYKPAKLYQVMDAEGNIGTTTDLPKDLVDAGLIQVVQSRDIQQPIIRHLHLNEVEILEETTFPGYCIPVIAVKGDEFWLDGKRKLKGTVEDAIDGQIMVNYCLSEMSRLIQIAPKAPYIGTAAQFKTFEQLWANLNVDCPAYITYNKEDGSPPPSRDLGSAQQIQAAAAMVQQAEESLKAVFGIFDASLGANGNEVSGKAILARQEQAHTTQYHFMDNLKRSMEHAGKILVDAIPTFYDGARVIRAVGVDGTKRSVPVNQPDELTGVVENDLTQGKYSVAIETGPSYGTKREAAVESMLTLMQAYPASGTLISDIMVAHSDWPGHQECAARLKAALPPEILQATEPDDTKDPEALITSLKTQLMQTKQQLEALNQNAMGTEQALKEAEQELQMEKMDKSIDAEKAKMDYEVKMRQLELDADTTKLEMQLEVAKLELERSKLQLMAEQQAAKLTDTLYGREVEHIERVSAADLKNTDTNLGGDLARNGL